VSRRGLPNPSAAHQRRVKILDELACLSGHFVSLNALPDGRRPDVLRLNLAGRALFVGDAKATEHPVDAAARARLESYASWIAAHVRAGGVGLFVVCAGNLPRAADWASALDAAGYEHGLASAGPRSALLVPGLAVGWTTYQRVAVLRSATLGQNLNLERLAPTLAELAHPVSGRR
jgi:phosphoglycolate phosphatase-like HAD superfamily hydrolase